MNLFEGVVEKSTGSWYLVRDPQNKVWRCRMQGKQRMKDSPYTNPVAVGDRVEVLESEEEATGSIQKILPRRNYVGRQSPHNRVQMHLLAANVDQSVLFATVIQPTVKPGFIDRFLLTNESHNVPGIIVFNKADLYSDEDMEIYNYLRDIYTQIGYPVILVSALTGLGLDEMRALLIGKTSLLSGQSGVGKTTVVNALDTNLDLRTGEISDYTGKGQHTTTFAEMYQLSFGGTIIDTPGIKALSFNNLDTLEIAHNFREFFVLSQKCRFGATCMHRQEPNCAVKAGLETGEVSELRYNNYLQLLEEYEKQNYWEIL